MAEQPDGQLNFFEQIADRQMTAPAKARVRSAEKRAASRPALSAQEKKLREQSMQARRYRAERRQQVKEQYNGKNKQGWQELRRALRQMSLEDPEQLVNHIAKAAWLHAADLDTRYLALSIIGSAITRLRERNGHEPFDDSLPSEAPTVFEIIRNDLILRRRAS